KEHTMTTTIKIIRNDRAVPQGKLADAELHFIGGELDGLKLLGFGVWERRRSEPGVDGNGARTDHLNVTFPARSFTVHGERRNFALVRAIHDPAAQDRLRELVLQAYRAQEPMVEVAKS
ncbi:MAG: hypothetical protein KJ066_23980, partial [Acidobacteria bacterium]|nr:hypothetical protein [Acidobacteriota bacterium]